MSEQKEWRIGDKFSTKNMDTLIVNQLTEDTVTGWMFVYTRKGEMSIEHQTHDKKDVKNWNHNIAV